MYVRTTIDQSGLTESLIVTARKHTGPRKLKCRGEWWCPRYIFYCIHNRDQMKNWQSYKLVATGSKVIAIFHVLLYGTGEPSLFVSDWNEMKNLMTERAPIFQRKTNWQCMQQEKGSDATDPDTGKLKHTHTHTEREREWNEDLITLFCCFYLKCWLHWHCWWALMFLQGPRICKYLTTNMAPMLLSLSWRTMTSITSTTVVRRVLFRRY